jgi:alkylated DNA repair protein alkB family protein 7
VISSYREMNLSSWPKLPSDEQTAQLLDILKKMYSLLPSEPDADSSLTGPPHLLTHLLHLSSNGYILPHVDNIEASAGTIVGISLGAERTLVLEDGQDRIDVRLPTGSAYLQRFGASDAVYRAAIDVRCAGAISDTSGSTQSRRPIQQILHREVRG